MAIGLVVDPNWLKISGGGILAGLFVSQYFSDLPTLKPLVLEPGDPKALKLWLAKVTPDVILTCGYEREMQDMLAQAGGGVRSGISVAGMNLHDAPPGLAGIDHLPEAYGRALVEHFSQILGNFEKGLPDTPVLHAIEGIWQDGDSVPKKLPS